LAGACRGAKTPKRTLKFEYLIRQSLPDYPPVTSADEQTKAKNVRSSEKALVDEFISRKGRHVKNVAQILRDLQQDNRASEFLFMVDHLPRTPRHTAAIATLNPIPTRIHPQMPQIYESMYMKHPICHFSKKNRR